MINFILYDIETGIPFLHLPELPENIDDMVSSGEIWYKGSRKARGVKFGSGAEWDYYIDGVPGGEETDEGYNFKIIDGEVVLNVE